MEEENISEAEHQFRNLKVQAVAISGLETDITEHLIKDMACKSPAYDDIEDIESRLSETKIRNEENEIAKPFGETTHVCAMQGLQTEKNNSKPQESYDDINVHELVDDILDHIVCSPVPFKSQQITDEKLTREDKKVIGLDMLYNKPLQFLTRFGQYLKQSHLVFYKVVKVKYCSQSFLDKMLEELEIELDPTKLARLKKNRRFEAMKRMQRRGEYFSLPEMMKREPYIYHQLVGRYLTEKEVLENKIQRGNKVTSFSQLLLFKLEKEEFEMLHEKQRKLEEAFEDDDDSYDEEQEVKSKKRKARWGEDWEEADQWRRRKKIKSPKIKQLLPAEKQLMHEEFKSICYTKFLEGQDIDFDYSAVDNDPEYDFCEFRVRDEEEKYFDSEDPCLVDNAVCMDTGEYDY